jgi:hypothetical protein
MARSESRAAREGSKADGRLRSHPALIALVRLLARQAAREALIASRVEQENNRNDEED